MALRKAGMIGQRCVNIFVMIMVMVVGMWGMEVEGKEPAKPKPKATDVASLIDDIAVEGAIDGRNITFSLEFDVKTTVKRPDVPLVAGDVVLDEIETSGKHKLRYDAGSKTYHVGWKVVGKYQVKAKVAARAKVMKGGAWREAMFTIPASRVRNLKVVCDRKDLEIRFPGALRLKRGMEDGKPVVTALLGPGRPFVVRWKPQIQKLKADLVATTHVSTVGRIGAGTVNVGTLTTFEISQGEMKGVSFLLPAGLSVTQVTAVGIRDWKIADAAGGGKRLTIDFVSAKGSTFLVYVKAEKAVDAFPTEFVLPVITPEQGNRVSGQLAVGADGAIQLVPKKITGLTQIEAGGFLQSKGLRRRMPSHKTFYYNFSTKGYGFAAELDHIVPMYDAQTTSTLRVKEDNLYVQNSIELDIRDAPLRQVELEAPAGLVVSSVVGKGIEDYNVSDADAAAKGRGVGSVVRIHFKQPVLGKTLVQVQSELGKGPLGQAVKVRGMVVKGARAQRGNVQVALEEGVDADEPVVRGLRAVHADSLPVRVGGARHFYKFRSADWTLSLTPRGKPATIIAEGFHLISLGEGWLYGSVSFTYHISGAPVDELKFRITQGVGERVEFVGSDVQRAVSDGEMWTVKLNRKVAGDYNLLLVYSRKYGSGSEVMVGGVECAGVASQSGYVALASHLNLKLESDAALAGEMREVEARELPGDYRQLLTSPVIRAYRYAEVPHRRVVKVKLYDHHALLPAVIDIMELATRLRVEDGGDVNSTTVVRMKIKNRSQQFLSLKMPEGAKVWAARQVERDGSGRERAERLTISEEKGSVKLELIRPQNPKQPITIELEYTQAHGTSGRRIELQAPKSRLESTYARWTVGAQQDKALHDAGGNMLADQRDQTAGTLGILLKKVMFGWSEGTDAVFNESGVGLFMVMVFVGVAVLVGVWQRRYVKLVVGVGLMLMLVVVGVRAIELHKSVVVGNAAQKELGMSWTDKVSMADSLRQVDDWSVITYAQPLNLEDKKALTVTVGITEAEAQYLTGDFYPLILVGLAAVALGGVFGRVRWLLIAGGLTLMVSQAAEYPRMVVDDADWHLQLFLGHVLTWGLPAAGVLYLFGRVCVGTLVGAVKGRRGEGKAGSGSGAVTAASLMLVVGVVLGGCAAGPVEVDVPVGGTLDHVDLKLTAEADTMKMDYVIKAEVDKGRRFRLIGDEAVLLARPKGVKDVKLVTEGGAYYVEFKKGGKYEVPVTFLMPLGEADGKLERRFGSVMPSALSNRVKLTVGDPTVEIECPTAIRFKTARDDQATTADVILGPSDRLEMRWRPRERQTRLEKTVVFADTTSLAVFDTAVVKVHHRIDLQIAQGELKQVDMTIPEGLTVTRVVGANIGTWRFDPATRLLETRLIRAVSGAYPLTILTQATGEKLPWKAKLGHPVIKDAARQHGMMGLTTNRGVYLTVTKSPQSVNTADFFRSLDQGQAKAAGLKANDIRYAYRLAAAADVIEVTVNPVTPELRMDQVAMLLLSDERLTYEGRLGLTVSKAGVFTADLSLPKDFDIEALGAAAISHWDELEEGGARVVRVHFRQKLQGTIGVQLKMTQPLAAVPKEVVVPRVGLKGAVKQTGVIRMGAAKGLQLALATKTGVSELPIQRDRGGNLIYGVKLLREDWTAKLGVTALEAHTSVEALHVARIDEHAIRHTHILRYTLAYAGRKFFDLRLPANAKLARFEGRNIASRKKLAGGGNVYRVELKNKHFTGAYHLVVNYETPLGKDAEGMTIDALTPVGVQTYQGHVIIRAPGKAELARTGAKGQLLETGAREVAKKFGLANLPDTVFAYRTTDAGYQIELSAKRLAAAAQPGASVRQTLIQTVVNERGQTINRVQLDMNVSSKRYLSMVLPEGSVLWSLTVNKADTPPSKSVDGKRWLIPLAEATLGDTAGQTSDARVLVDLIYVRKAEGNYVATSPAFMGPKFDLPLKNIRWLFFVPEDRKYVNFRGALTVERELVQKPEILKYDIGAYDQQVAAVMVRENREAGRLMELGKQSAAKGDQRLAKQLLKTAYNYSFNDVALNEDTLVQWQRLNRQNAMVGLKQRRKAIRPGADQSRRAIADAIEYTSAGGFTAKDAEREIGALDKHDADNLQAIAVRMLSVQHANAKSVAPLEVHMPLSGRVLEFRRSVPITPEMALQVSYATEDLPEREKEEGMVYLFGLFGVLLVVGLMLALFGWSPGGGSEGEVVREEVKEEENTVRAEAGDGEMGEDDDGEGAEGAGEDEGGDEEKA